MTIGKRGLMSGTMLIALLAACSQYTESETTEPAGDEPPVRAAQAHEDLSDTLDVNGVERSFIAHFPTGYSPDRPAPLVVNLHGLSATNQMQVDYTEFNSSADISGYVSVYPQGQSELVRGQVQPHWNANFGTQADDVTFISELIDLFIADFGIDRRRVFVTGFSNGGFMSYHLACTISEKIAAIAPVGGQMRVTGPQTCELSHNIPVLHFHSDNDQIVPITGIPQFTMSVTDTTAYFANRYGCEEEPIKTAIEDRNADDQSTATHWDYQGCQDGGAVEVYISHNGGHTWPDALESEELGVTNRDINANKLILSFFDRYQLPE